jgi:hypothetical protein
MKLWRFAVEKSNLILEQGLSHLVDGKYIFILLPYPLTIMLILFRISV